MIRDGVLSPGDQLPSVRELSAALQVNPNTVAKSYLALAERGLTVSAHGSGSFVSERAGEILAAADQMKLTDLDELVRALLKTGISEEVIRQILDNALSGKGG